MPNGYKTKYKLGTYYSSSRGGQRVEKYRLKLGFESKIFDFIYNIDFDHAIDFSNNDINKSDSFIKISLNYFMD